MHSKHYSAARYALINQAFPNLKTPIISSAAPVLEQTTLCTPNSKIKVIHSKASESSTYHSNLYSNNVIQSSNKSIKINNNITSLNAKIASTPWFDGDWSFLSLDQAKLHCNYQGLLGNYTRQQQQPYHNKLITFAIYYSYPELLWLYACLKQNYYPKSQIMK